MDPRRNLSAWTTLRCQTAPVRVACKSHAFRSRTSRIQCGWEHVNWNCGRRSGTCHATKVRTKSFKGLTVLGSHSSLSSSTLRSSTPPSSRSDIAAHLQASSLIQSSIQSSIFPCVPSFLCSSRLSRPSIRTTRISPRCTFESTCGRPSRTDGQL